MGDRARRGLSKPVFLDNYYPLRAAPVHVEVPPPRFAAEHATPLCRESGLFGPGPPQIAKARHRRGGTEDGGPPEDGAPGGAQEDPRGIKRGHAREQLPQARKSGLPL